MCVYIYLFTLYIYTHTHTHTSSSFDVVAVVQSPTHVQLFATPLTAAC